MRQACLALVCAFVLTSCASMGGSGAQLTTGIRGHAFAVKKVVIFGEGVSPQAAESLAQDAGAMVLSSPSLKSARSSSAVISTLRAIVDSGDAWDVMVAERARGLMTRILARMKAAELSKFSGKLIVPDTVRDDRVFQDQVKRVFGESVMMEYIQPGKK